MLAKYRNIQEKYSYMTDQKELSHIQIAYIFGKLRDTGCKIEIHANQHGNTYGNAQS